MAPPPSQWWVANGWNFSVWWTLHLDFIRQETSLVTTATAVTSPMNTLSHWLARSYHGRCHLLDRRANHELIRSRTEVLPEAAIWGSPKDTSTSWLQRWRFEPPASGPQPPLCYHNCSTFLCRQIMLPEFCPLWGGGGTQQGILGRGVSSCLSEDGEAAERRAGSRQEPRGELHAGSLGSVSCLPWTRFLSVRHGVAGMGRDTRPSRVPLGSNLQSLRRFISDTFCTRRRACYPSHGLGRALESHGSSAKRPSLFLC